MLRSTRWTSHARFEDVSRKGGRLGWGYTTFRPKQTTSCGPCLDGTGIFDHGSKPHELKGCCHPAVPLHYVSWGLHNIVEFLVLEHPQDVHSQGPTDNATPLHLASKNGHAEVARILIEHKCASERCQVLQQATKVLFILHRMEFNSC